VWLALLAAMRGDGPETQRQLQAALTAVEGRPAGLIEDGARWVRGVLALGEGHPGDALSHLAPIAHPVVEVFASLDRLEAAAAAQDARGAAWLGGLRDLAEATGAGWARARLAYGEALLAISPAEAEERFARAVEEAAGVQRPFERARISLAFGSHLRRHRQRARARVPLRAALDAFETLGAQVWADRARRELRAAGETVHGRERRAVDELTPQELQIAREVAQGRTNREVAARFFLSPRTVEFHLGNVFAKLGIRSRTELARLPLADPVGPPAS
jgi:DNA-binding CsgD family transcriptional regulator